MSKLFFVSLAILILPLTVLAATTNLDNPLPINNLSQGAGYIGSVIKQILGIIGAVALLMMIYGGLTMVMSGGNEKKVAEGKNIVTYTAIGLVVIFMSYTAITFFMNTLGGRIEDEYRDLPTASDSAANNSSQTD